MASYTAQLGFFPKSVESIPEYEKNRERIQFTQESSTTRRKGLGSRNTVKTTGSEQDVAETKEPFTFRSCSALFVQMLLDEIYEQEALRWITNAAKTNTMTHLYTLVRRKVVLWVSHIYDSRADFPSWKIKDFACGLLLVHIHHLILSLFRFHLPEADVHMLDVQFENLDLRYDKTLTGTTLLSAEVPESLVKFVSTISSRQYEAASRSIFDCGKLAVLKKDLATLIIHTYGSTLNIERSLVLFKSLEGPATTYVEFRLAWDVQKFVEDYGTADIDMGQVLAITGNASAAQMTTVSAYIQQTWPAMPNILLNALRFKKLTVRAGERSHFKSCSLTTKHGRMSVRVEASIEVVAVIAQQLAWLSAACRFSKGGPCYADTQWRDISTAQQHIFEITATCAPMDEAEEKLCWHSLTGDTVIVSGFPIAPRRSYDMGLQIPIDIMAALGGVSLAVDEGQGFYFRGRDAKFVPVSRADGHVQWHLRTFESKDFGYTDNTVNAQTRLDQKALRTTTAFLGWATEILNNAGTEELSYRDIDWSGSSALSQSNMQISNVVLSFSQYIGASVNFVINRRNLGLEVNKDFTYDDILNDLIKWSVVMYDTRHSKAWLIDGLRAVLQIIVHYGKLRTGYFLEDIQVALPYDLESAERAMRVNGNKILREDLDADNGEPIKIPFSRMVKHVWEKLKHIARVSHNEYKNSLHWSDVSLRRRRALYGYEYMDLVTANAQHESNFLKERLKNDSGRWPDLVTELRVPVLYGQNFGEVFVPNAAVCPRFQVLPSGASYLAVDATIIHRLLVQHRRAENLWRLTSSNLSWIAAESSFKSCLSHARIGSVQAVRCLCSPIQKIKRVEKRKVVIKEILRIQWKTGALIFGRQPNLVMGSSTTYQGSKNQVRQHSDATINLTNEEPDRSAQQQTFDSYEGTTTSGHRQRRDYSPEGFPEDLHLNDLSRNPRLRQPPFISKIHVQNIPDNANNNPRIETAELVQTNAPTSRRNQSSSTATIENSPYFEKGGKKPDGRSSEAPAVGQRRGRHSSTQEPDGFLDARVLLRNNVL